MEAIRREPGLGVRELAKRTGHSGITVSKHLARLREAGLVIGVKSGAKVHHFLPGKVQDMHVRLPDSWRRLLDWLDELPVTINGLRAHMPNVPLSTLKHQLRRLRELGHIEADTTTRPVVYSTRERQTPKGKKGHRPQLKNPARP